MTEDTAYKDSFPKPPKFKSNFNSNISFEVPKYYGYEHPCTKWLLSCIVSNQALGRLVKVGTSYNHILKRYHQIPDRPSLVLKDKFSLDRAAFNNQAILYMRPLSIAIYMKYEDAIIKLVNLKDENGNQIVNPHEMAYVHNFWRKGDSKYFSDLVMTYPPIIAIRRNYFEAFKYLLQAGYKPNEKFTIIYRKPHREIIIQYRDILDYVVDYLKTRPALNVNKLMLCLLNTSTGLNILDIFCFDLVNDNLKQNFNQTKNNNNTNDTEPRTNKIPISLFHRISHYALDSENLSEENGMHIINMLEKIQEAGYFNGIGSIQSANNENVTISLLSLIENNYNSGKIYLNDLHHLSIEEQKLLLTSDYRWCISNLFIWLQNKAFRRKTEQTSHILNLLIRILFDTGYLEYFFKCNTSSDAELLMKFSEFPLMKNYLQEITVYNIRLHLISMIQNCEQLMINFFSRYKTEPQKILLLNDTEHFKKHLTQSWVMEEALDLDFRTRYIRNIDNKCDEEKNQNNFVQNNSNYNTVITDDDVSNDGVVITSTMTYFYKEQHKYININNCLNNISELDDTNSNISLDSHYICTNPFDELYKDIDIKNDFIHGSEATIEVDLAEVDRKLSNSVAQVYFGDDTTTKIDEMTITETTIIKSNQEKISIDDIVNKQFTLPLTKSNPPPLLERRYKEKSIKLVK